MNDLKQAIVSTVVYFDIFDYPLTALEIWKWLNTDESRPPAIHQRQSYWQAGMAHRFNLLDIEEALSQMSEKIGERNGFYFLKGRQEIIEKRLKRYSYAEDKFKRAVKFVKILRLIPFIKMIAVCNTLAYSNATKEGDIDLFIVAQKNRLWLTRFLAVGFLKWLGVRPSDESKQDAIDATFFLSEDKLNIENLKLEIDQDIYLTYWVDQIVPVYDVDSTYNKFQEANQWIKETLPHSFGCQLNERRIVRQNWLVKLGHWKNRLLFNWNGCEKLAKKLQLKIMPKVLKEMMNKDSRVIVNDKILKFHRHDRRAEYQRIFEGKLEMLK